MGVISFQSPLSFAHVCEDNLVVPPRRVCHGEGEGVQQARDTVEDVTVPMMTDTYWDSDTVFFSFEHDYRFRTVPVAQMTQSLDPRAQKAWPGEELARKEVMKRPASKTIKGQWFEHPANEGTSGRG